jgi:hypothetical protein
MTDIVERLRDCHRVFKHKDIAEAADEIERLRVALEPFVEIAKRLGWDKLDEHDHKLDDHIIDAPADDIAPGAFYCLMVSAFHRAAKT